MGATGRAARRRQADGAFVSRYFVGLGLDILGESDPLALYQEFFPRIGGVREWRAADGDAASLAGVPDWHFDFVHAAFALQRQEDPAAALSHWFRVVKPGGHLVILVPDEDLYEQGVFPSNFAKGHRWSFTVFKSRSFHGRSTNLLDLVLRLGAAADLRRLAVIEEGYRRNLPRWDQTLGPTAESAIELVLRRRTEAEIAFGGEGPRKGGLTDEDRRLLSGGKA